MTRSLLVLIKAPDAEQSKTNKQTHMTKVSFNFYRLLYYFNNLLCNFSRFYHLNYLKVNVYKVIPKKSTALAIFRIEFRVQETLTITNLEINNKGSFINEGPCPIRPKGGGRGTVRLGIVQALKSASIISSLAAFSDHPSVKNRRRAPMMIG